MPTRRTVLALPLALPLIARAENGFGEFLGAVAREAHRAGVPFAVSDAAFAGLTPDPAVIARDRTQPEFTLTWPQYRARVLPTNRLRAARDQYRANHALLGQIGDRYGVAPRVVLAIWGIESDFGAITGKFSLIRSLATLAYDARRGSYFKRELIAALQILAAGYATPAMLTSGWAGAMGQPQFMPSAYLQSAVDFDGGGRRDIWNSVPDALASIAHYLAQRGWQTGGSWGERFTGTPGRLAPEDRYVVPNGAPDDEIYLVHANFQVIKRYNPSDFYALAVGLLSDAAA